MFLKRLVLRLFAFVLVALFSHSDQEARSGWGGRASGEKPEGLSPKWTFSHNPVSGELLKSVGFGLYVETHIAMVRGSGNQPRSLKLL